MPQESRPSDGKSGMWIVAGVVLVAIGLAAWLLKDRRPGGPLQPPGNAGDDRLSAEECRRLTERINLGLAHLEHEDNAEAIAVFGELVREWPGRADFLRNLVIAHIRSVAREDPEGAAPAEKAVSDGLLDSLLVRLEQAEPASPVPHILAGRVALFRKGRAVARGDGEAGATLEATAVRELEAAAALAPDDPAIWLELAEAAGAATDDTLRQKKSPALERASELAPENLALATRRLVDQAERKDRGIAKTIAIARGLVLPLDEPVRQRAGVSLVELLGQAGTAVEAGQWNVAFVRLRMLQNALLPEDWWRSDNRRVHDRHILEFMVQPGAETCVPEPISVEPPSIRFVRKTGPDALPPISGAGVRALRVLDFNLDGMFDIALLDAEKLSIYSRGNLTEAWRPLATSDGRAGMVGFLAGDLDREGVLAESGTALTAREREEKRRQAQKNCQEADLDFVLFGEQGARVYRNDIDDAGARRLTALEQSPEFDALRNLLAGVLVDIDHDGDLDLVFSSAAGISIWLNRGNMLFYPVANRSQLPPEGLRATALIAVDWDSDFDLDVIAVGDSGAGVLENMRHGQLRWREFERPLSELAGCRDLRLVDGGRPNRWTLAGGGAAGITRVADQRGGGNGARNGHAESLSKSPVQGLLTWDFDNDGLMDLLAWDGSAPTVYRAQSADRAGNESYAVLSDAFDSPVVGAATCAVGDLDGDGDLDLVVAERDAVTIFDNDGGNKNHWLDLRIRGEEDNKSGGVNHLGIGSLIEIKAGPFHRQQIVTGQMTHFGLGSREKADVVRIVWTNGVPQVVLQPAANQSICEVHKVDSSCPFLYAWNGNRFEFCTDLLWNAPLGLQVAEGVVAKPRAWEYLKIDGRRMQPKDGKYVLQFTSELWEADYFDHVELIAVDHPSDVAIYSNEKVGPAEIAELKVHPVRRPRTPVAARNARGEDVLEIVAAADGNYLRGHTLNHMKGLTDEHFLELDLGDLKAGDLKGARQITLFLTGWLYPSNTSNRVAASQNPDLAPGKPPALQVPDSEGRWREVRPFMGFPGGKTKTIAVDLTGLFLTDDYRVRIVTNWELYWDHVFFTVDEEPAPLRMTPLLVRSADLHYRGFSRIIPGIGSAPDSYDYDDVNTAPHWAPMLGNFTRYGDVTELLAREDDLQVIFGSGDEMTVTFDVPDDPPAGWTRDFLLHNVGWDKDAVLNTLYGQTVEPLPFHGMSGYPYGADEAYPQRPEHQKYLRDYQTRIQSTARFWNQIRDFRTHSD